MTHRKLRMNAPRAAFGHLKEGEAPRTAGQSALAQRFVAGEGPETDVTFADVQEKDQASKGDGHALEYGLPGYGKHRGLQPLRCATRSTTANTIR